VAAATALAMIVGRLSNIRTNTLRAFTAAELATVLDKVVQLVLVHKRMFCWLKSGCD
jgi:hypothetical protein